MPRYLFGLTALASLIIALHGSYAAQAQQPAVRTALTEWRRSMDMEKAGRTPPPPQAGFAEQLSYRVFLDQTARNAVPENSLAQLADAEKAEASRLVWREVAKIDRRNLIFIKRHLPRDGWFRYSRDGREVGRDAWVIVQHAADAKFQEKILLHMKPLVALHEASGEDYALLYDHIQVAQGKPQMFGSQIACINGGFTPGPLIEPAGLDQRRAAFGLKPFDEYFKWWKGRKC